MRTPSILPVAVLVSSLAACGTSRNIEGSASGASVCTVCHGGEDNQTGAPPLDTHGRSSSPAVGAHTSHLVAGVACRSCHLPVNPGDLHFPGHQNGVADVIFGGAAIDPGNAATPAYDRATHGCSNVYCHAPSAAPGGALPDPQWNGSIASAGCGACHAGPSAIHGGGVAPTACTACHPSSVDATGAVLPPPAGTHANGTVEHFLHDPGWAATNANGVTPHGLAAMRQDPARFPAGFDSCRTCHGSNLDNPIASSVPSCDACHTGGTAAWRTTCTFCHGDATRAPAGYQLADAAPPRDILGNAASPAVGAHKVHLSGQASPLPAISNGVACDDCHGGTARVLPSSFEPHANATVEVTLKRPGQNVAIGSFSPSTVTCSNTYCHGNLPRNPKTPPNVPAWTDTGTQKNCGACHAPNGAYGGADTMTDQHANHRCARCHGADNGVGCFACHGPGYQSQIGSTLPTVGIATHVNGALEIVTSSSPSGQPITITYDSVSQSCTTSCHGIGAHQSRGAPSGSATW